MSAKPKFQPDNYHTATPYLIVDGADKAIEYYRQAFGAIERVRMEVPGGTVGHAEIQIGDSMLMLADEAPSCDARSPHTIGGTPVSLMLYFPDVDVVFQRAVSLGAKMLKPVEDQFYGDRSGTLQDPFGHKWTIATHTEDVAPEEMEKRMAALFGAK